MSKYQKNPKKEYLIRCIYLVYLKTEQNNIGSNFDDFLKEEALLDEATVMALKRVIAWQIAEEMKAQNLTQNS